MVDIIVVDCHIDFTHPEFDSRAKKINWFKYCDNVPECYSKEYQYEGIRPFKGPLGSHGTAVAGVIAGNTFGIAKNANIYNIHYDYDFYSELDWKNKYFDCIVNFHNSKPNNNPTICNFSLGWRTGQMLVEDIESIFYRNESLSVTEIKSIIPEEHFLGDEIITRIPTRDSVIDRGIKKLLDNGIIVVGCSRNSSLKVDVPGGLDYDNHLVHKEYGKIYINRGSSPGCAPGVVCVSSIGYDNGPRIDYYEDGSDTLTCVRNRSICGARKDPRSENHEIIERNGTSIAAAKITGKLALILEQNPQMTQENARTILNKNKNGNVI